MESVPVTVDPKEVTQDPAEDEMEFEEYIESIDDISLNNTDERASVVEGNMSVANNLDTIDGELDTNDSDQISCQGVAVLDKDERFKTPVEEEFSVTNDQNVLMSDKNCMSEDELDSSMEEEKTLEPDIPPILGSLKGPDENLEQFPSSGNKDIPGSEISVDNEGATTCTNISECEEMEKLVNKSASQDISTNKIEDGNFNMKKNYANDDANVNENEDASANGNLNENDDASANDGANVNENDDASENANVNENDEASANDDANVSENKDASAIDDANVNENEDASAIDDANVNENEHAIANADAIVNENDDASANDDANVNKTDASAIDEANMNENKDASANDDAIVNENKDASVNLNGDSNLNKNNNAFVNEIDVANVVNEERDELPSSGINVGNEMNEKAKSNSGVVNDLKQGVKECRNYLETENVTKEVPVNNGLVVIPPKTSAFELSDVIAEDMKCMAENCKHRAHSMTGLILHLSSHWNFELISSSKETKFSYACNKYQCSTCPLVTSHRVVFYEHVRHHLLHHPYKCGHCGEGVESVQHLRQHNRTTHRQLLVKLTVNENAHVDSVMNNLGPKAPPADKNLTLPDNRSSAMSQKISTEKSRDITRLEEMCDKIVSSPENKEKDSVGTKDCHGVSRSDQSSESKDLVQSLAKNDKMAIAEIKSSDTKSSAPRSEHMVQNFKYSLTRDGKFFCAHCKFAVVDIPMFTSHVFEDIHKALKIPCVECGQNSTGSVESVAAKDCSIVRQVINALIKRKEMHTQLLLKEKEKLLNSDKSIKEKDDNSLSNIKPDADARVKPEGFTELKPPLSESRSRRDAQDSAQVPKESMKSNALKAAVLSSKSANAETPVEKDKDRANSNNQNESNISEDNNRNDEQDDLIVLNSSDLDDDDDAANEDKDCSRCSIFTRKATTCKNLNELENELQERIERLPGNSTSNNILLSYKCGMSGCDFSSRVISNLKLHCMLKHTKVDSLPCSLCQKTFVNEDELLDHVYTNHNQLEKGMYLCAVPDCGISFHRIMELKFHFSSNHPNLASFPCSFCFKELSVPEQLLPHIQSHLKNTLKCSYCKKVFDDKEDLLAHISETHKGLSKKINIFIKIINHDRLNKKEGDTEATPSDVEPTSKDKSGVNASKPLSGDLKKSEVKPKKKVALPDVEITALVDKLAQSCEKCTFTCNSELQLKMHMYECHAKESGEKLAFACRFCSMSSDAKESLQKHMAHHTGKHIIRYYVCPYCQKQSNQMTVIEDHVTIDHPNELFKFEVLQDSIEYLQDMLQCPVCKGGFQWKPDFLHHIGSVHRLEDLVAFLDARYPDKPCLQHCKVPRNLFKGLLPSTGAEEDDAGTASDDDAVTFVGSSDASEKRTKEVPKKDGMILRFHCDRCEFSSNDFNVYKNHLESHEKLFKDEKAEISTSSFESVGMEMVNNNSGPLVVSGRRAKLRLVCPLCPFVCNKSLNYRRHLAIHERTKTMSHGYKCGYCQFLHDRINCIKFHLGKYHGDQPLKLVRIVGGVEEEVAPDDELLKPTSSSAKLHLGKNFAAPLAAAPLSAIREKRVHKKTNRWSASWETAFTNGFRLSRQFLKPHIVKSSRSKAMGENIATDYMESELPPGMIYPEPIKCPKCNFTNRVRINLVRHMKLHRNENDIESRNNFDHDLGISFEGGGYMGNMESSMDSGNMSIKMEPDDGSYVRRQSTLLHVLTGADNNSKSFHSEDPRCSSVKSEPSDNLLGSPNMREGSVERSFNRERSTPDGSSSGFFEAGSTSKKLFKCAYCSMTSKWNRRDISLHILHIHLQKRVYTCQYCSYGSSKTSSVVMSHCAKIHPNRPIAVKDELALFNSILPMHEGNGVVPVAYMKSENCPILELEELGRHLNLPVRQEKDPLPQSQLTHREAPDLELPSPKKRRVQEFEKDLPLDLSVKCTERSSTSMEDDVQMEEQDEDAEDFDGMKESSLEWRCSLCGFQNPSAGRVKHHIICHHLKLKPYSCPYCRLYQWREQAVINHIEKFHPGMGIAPLATVDERSAYLSRNMAKVGLEDLEELDVLSRRLPNSTAAFYRCRLCGFQEVRHDKTKYHVIKHHLKIGLFSCPHCKRYMWGRNYVARHIRESHPGKEISIRRTFDEYANYLQNNIKKIGGSPHAPNTFRRPLQVRSFVKPVQRSSGNSGSPEKKSQAQILNIPTMNTIQFPCPSCGYIADSEASLAAHSRVHKLYECCYCSFRNTLAAKVQSHCLTKHPTKPVKHRQVEPTPKQPEKSPSPALQMNVKTEYSDGFDDAPAKLEQEEPEMSYETDLDTDRGASNLRPGTPLEMYMCRYCNLVLWNVDEMKDHLADSHPEEPPDFEVIKEPGENPLSSLIQEAASLGDLDADNLSDDGTGALTIDLERDKTAQSDDDGEGTIIEEPLGRLDLSSFIFKCRLCTYHSDKVTVMRHHVMSHLLYHPYRCPYCPNSHSVKSSPITKHIRLKHPGEELQFSCDRDEEMERQVRNSYYRTLPNGTEPTSHPRPSFRPSRQPMVTAPSEPTYSKLPRISRRAFYKCNICNLVTHIRTDMKHHLMREIHYKPYTCGYCGYVEPSKSGMGKHFRSKHSGMAVDIQEVNDPEKEAQIEQLLEECVIRHDPDNMESRKFQQEFMHRNRGFRSSSHPRPPSFRSESRQSIEPAESSSPSHSQDSEEFSQPPVDVPPKPSVSSSLRMHVKIHRCTQCSYSSTSLRPLQVHMVKHRPCRLQCGYCSHKSHYPSWIRKHIRSSHPGMQFKYCKVPSGSRSYAPEISVKVEEEESIEVPDELSETESKPPPVLKKAPRPPTGPALLDGIQLDIPLIPDSFGMYHCPQCDYQTANRSHYKMHSVTHRPRKWQCFYCVQKFPLVFRLRRHSGIKHPHLPVKWVDVSTGSVYDDFNSPSQTSQRMSSVYAAKATARKSLSGAAAHQVAKFRAAKLSSEDKSMTGIDEAMNENNDEMMNGDDSFSLNDLDDDSDQDSPIWFCCHECHKKFSVLDDFVNHMRTEHAPPESFPSLEILPATGEGELTLQRCGFCPYESFFKDDFDAHVGQHTDLQPVKCNHCQFASFVVKEIENHSNVQHPGISFSISLLDQPYTMTSDCQTLEDRRFLYQLNPVVRLVDMCSVLTPSSD